MDRKELELKIQKIKKRIEGVENSCSGLQREEFESYQSDRIYLKILEEKLKRIKK